MDVIVQSPLPLAPLPTEHNGKTLITFVFHKVDVNVSFFLKCGIVRHPNVDYCIVENTNSEPPSLTEHDYSPSKVYWMKRPNISQCFGGYSASARMLTEPYQYRFFINSTMRGPMLPPWAQKDKHWIEYFTELFNDSVAMVGSTINIDPAVHVQSMMMGVDQRALKILVDNKIFLPKDVHVDKGSLVSDHEVNGTQVVLKQGYNIDCLVTSFQGRNWQTEQTMPYDDLVKHDLWYVGAYYGQTLHPYETIFYKTNRSHIVQETPVDVLTYLIGKKQRVNDGNLPTIPNMTKIHSKPIIDSPILTAGKTHKNQTFNTAIISLSVVCAFLGIAVVTLLVLYFMRSRS